MEERGQCLACERKIINQNPQQFRARRLRIFFFSLGNTSGRPGVSGGGSALPRRSVWLDPF